MKGYCVKKNSDGTYRLAKKESTKGIVKKMDVAEALEKKIEDTKKGK